MSNPDRLMREAQDHAEFLLKSRGPVNARAWAIHNANRSTDGFWSRVLSEINRSIRESNAKAEADRSGFDEVDEANLADDRGDWQFHQEHDQ
jgi:hypothetical protein